MDDGFYNSPTHVMNLIFECTLVDGFEPRLSDNPDEYQIGIKWVRFDELDSIRLYPNIKSHIIEYAKRKRNIEIIEDYKLEKYVW